MAAEIRVDTIKGRSGINTLSFAGDGFTFDKNVGIGTTVVSDPVSANNPGKLAVGIVTCKEVYADGWNVSGITTVGGLKLGDGEQIIAGVGSDLTVFSDGSTSFLLANDLRLKNKASNGNYLVAATGAEVTLYHNNGARVTTSADGADIGGTGCVGITKGTTAQRPGSAAAGDFRYNTTTGKFEGYTSEWGDIGGGASEEDTSVSATTATAVYTVAHASYRSASLIIQITQGSAYQSGRYMVIHDGTTATIIEESAIATGSMLGTFTAGIDGSNLKVYVNMGSASSATVTVVPTPVTV